MRPSAFAIHQKQQRCMCLVFNLHSHPEQILNTSHLAIIAWDESEQANLVNVVPIYRHRHEQFKCQRILMKISFVFLHSWLIRYMHAVKMKPIRRYQPQKDVLYLLHGFGTNNIRVNIITCKSCLFYMNCTLVILIKFTFFRKQTIKIPQKPLLQMIFHK